MKDVKSRVVYVDNAAATPMDDRVLEAMRPFFSQAFYNPSANYWPAQHVRAQLETARAKVAHWFGARASEVVFTAGGTEGNNLAIRGIMEQFPDGNVVVSAIEHESVLAVARAFTCQEAPVSALGIVELEELKKRIDDHTVLVSIMYANNEVGSVQPIRRIAQMLAKVRAARKLAGNTTPLYFHTDAAQAANYLDLHAARLGVDLMTINAGKIYGPKQAGALLVGAHVQLKPYILGGGQERGLRSGTENIAGAVGLAAALDITQTMRHEEGARLQKLQKLFFDELEQNIPGVRINASRKQRLPNNVHVTLPGQDNERLLIKLDEAGILAAAGSACSASNDEASHVLRALGLSDEDARASLRFTMGRATTEDDVRLIVENLKHF